MNPPRHHRIGAAVVAYIAVVALATFGLLRVEHDSARVGELEKTNCALKQFLLTARQARLRAADGEEGVARARDFHAAAGYADLARRFLDVGVHCDRPVE